jgi:hypothetical protein
VKGLYGMDVEAYNLSIELDCKRTVKHPNGTKLVMIPVLPIFSLFHTIWSIGEQQFETTFLGQRGDRCQDYWQAAVNIVRAILKL